MKYIITVEVTVDDNQLYDGCPLRDCIRSVTLEDGTRIPEEASFKIVGVKQKRKRKS